MQTGYDMLNFLSTITEPRLLKLSHDYSAHALRVGELDGYAAKVLLHLLNNVMPYGAQVKDATKVLQSALWWHIYFCSLEDVVRRDPEPEDQFMRRIGAPTLFDLEPN